ncbi:MAG: phosphate ABC transporter substrate-binding protein [Deltaproteobacteria bacterium]|nr:phosphate ABC transporter substrate-binding protein [Deltaproteobacteria bacterium]
MHWDKTLRRSTVIFSIAMICVFLACTKKQGARTIIQNKGSDTLVNVAQAWAERYHQVNQKVSIAVTGGGSGIGIAALINGTVDIANASRSIKPEEAQKAKQNTGKDAVLHVVALDAIAVIVSKDNPIKDISIEELQCIWGEGGACSKWSDVRNINVPGCANNEIVRVSRQSNSGTYQYFREAILGERRDFKLGSRDMHGSKDVVDLVEKTVCAISYTGMGYLSPNVRALCISKKRGQPCVEPTPQTALNRTYPIARELYMYTLGEPTGEIKAYLDWVRAPEGQKIVNELGYVSIAPPPKAE